MTETMTIEQFRALKKKKPSKYRNKKCIYDGHAFDSQKERDRYIMLRYQEIKGEISNLRTQVEYGCQVCTYIADFVYKRNGKIIVEDVKGFKTQVYRLKKKLMKQVHGIDIVEI